MNWFFMLQYIQYLKAVIGEIMKIGIVSDIHSNLEAFIKALNLLHSLEVEKIYSCGDIVGYGPNPNECVNLVRENSIISVIGNHDFGVIKEEFEFKFNSYARDALRWTRNILSLENTNFLKELPLFLEEPDFTFFHGMFKKSNPFQYIISDYDAWLSLKDMNTNIGFFGHSHIAGAYVMSKDSSIKFIPGTLGTKFEIQEDKRYLINVGSVGQPRDGNPSPAFTVYDSDSNTVEIKRFTYDIEKVYKKIVSYGLPVFLGERLFIGA